MPPALHPRPRRSWGVGSSLAVVVVVGAVERRAAQRAGVPWLLRLRRLLAAHRRVVPRLHPRPRACHYHQCCRPSRHLVEGRLVRPWAVCLAARTPLSPLVGYQTGPLGCLVASPPSLAARPPAGAGRAGGLLPVPRLEATRRLVRRACWPLARSRRTVAALLAVGARLLLPLVPCRRLLLEAALASLLVCWARQFKWASAAQQGGMAVAAMAPPRGRPAVMLVRSCQTIS